MLALTNVNYGDLRSVWLRNYNVFVRLWRTEVVAPLFEPIFSVIGFGWGIGSLVAGKVMGVPYLTFVGAGLLAFTALLRALFECTYGSYFRMVYQSTFDAVLCTPVEVESLAMGEIASGAAKAIFNGVFVLAVLTAVGAVQSLWGILIPVVLGIGALWVAALSILVTSRIHDIDYFNFYMAFFFSYLWISGAYFPLTSMPKILQIAAWLVPVTGTVDVIRSLMTGNIGWSSAIELLYVILAFLVTAEFALRSLRRRLVS
ncbi:MAG: ABC transporter permease [Blastocatellia bacterium]|nr:ABC transporter permease [Blastocatellia bacterium]